MSLPTVDIVVGGLCYLKSGSPEMTIRGIGVSTVEGEVGLIQCVWIVNGIVVSGDFPAACLRSSFPGTTGFATDPPMRGIIGG
jgi:uncharacterized protein YodC (DUF2158 family)